MVWGYMCCLPGVGDRRAGEESLSTVIPLVSHPGGLRIDILGQECSNTMTFREGGGLPAAADSRGKSWVCVEEPPLAASGVPLASGHQDRIRCPRSI